MAIKAVSIREIMSLGKERHINREKELLEELKFKNTHVINLLSAFKDNTNLYFEFEIAANGSLDDLIKNCKGQIGE